MADQERKLPTVRRDPTLLRAELAQTRARMSETIDEIEEVIVEKKEEVIALAKGIRQRLDPFYKARQNPVAAVGIVFGAGLLLGAFTKGRKRKAARALVEAIATTPAPPPERSDLWESRARRLLRIAREQEEELEALRAREPDQDEEAHDAVDDYDYDDYDDDDDDD